MNVTKQPQDKIASLLAEARDKIKSAETLADEYGLDFEFSLGYGMGGIYFGRKKPLTKAMILKMIADNTFGELSYSARLEAAEVLAGNQETVDWQDSYAEQGWNSSSSRC